MRVSIREIIVFNDGGEWFTTSEARTPSRVVEDAPPSSAFALGYSGLRRAGGRILYQSFVSKRKTR